METVQSPPGQFIQSGEAARLLAVSPVTINRWRHAGRLRVAAYAGNQPLYSRQDVMQLAKDRRRDQNPSARGNGTTGR